MTNEATTTTAPTLDRLITPAELAQRLGASITSIYNWAGGSQAIIGFPMPVCLGGRRTRFRESDVAQYIAGLTSTVERKHHLKGRSKKAA